MNLSPGAHVRSFEVLGLLGAGGMGAVYRARDGKLGRDVALKILQDDLSGNREYLHRFEREARAASALNHPNIITIFEINDFEGAPFIAMELIEGMSLRELLKKGPVPMRKLLDVAAQIADGLASAHERGIVHRDLKPENVMLTHDGRVKILDFGLARVNRPATSGDATSELSSIRTPEGRIVGTASYVSPEQAGGGHHVDYRSDQFSFGSLLYELATGRRPFERNSVVETLAAIMREEPEPPQRLNPRLPPPLCWIVERCLSKDPSDRYTSTSDLARELRTLRERLPETSPGRMPLPGRWSLRARAGAIAALVIAAAIAIVSASHRFGSPVEQLPRQKYLAILPFNDTTGRADGHLFSQGFGEAVGARLSKYSGIQVIPAATFADLSAKQASPQRIAQQVGATLLLNATVQRSGDDLRVSYSLIDPKHGTDVTGDAINGSVRNIWAVQDQVADHVANDLGVVQRKPPTQHVGLETPDEQDLYVHALGALEHSDDEKSIDVAINLLRELTETASDCALVHAALGRAYLAKYNLTHDKDLIRRAFRSSDRARAIDPDSPDVLRLVAKIQRLSGETSDSIVTYKRALSIQPDSPEAATELGVAYETNHQYSEAEQWFRRGIQLRPTWWSGYSGLGHLYLKQQRFADAIAQDRQVVKLNPRSPWGYVNLGSVYLYEGRLSDAADQFLTALSFQPDAFAYSNLGYCYYFLGDFEDSAASFRKAANLRPNIATSWANLGDSCSWASSCRGEATQFYVKAIDLLKQDLQLNPNNVAAHATLAICLAKTGDRKGAQEHIARALQLQPDDPSRMYQAARVANLAGRQQEAISMLRKALAKGYQRYEVDHDPEFAALRKTAQFQTALTP